MTDVTHSILSTFRAAWQGSQRFRLTFGLAASILGIMALASLFLAYSERRSIQESAELRGLSFSRALAMMGAPAVLENLFLVQEAMSHYLNEPDVLQVDVIDVDDMIMASKHRSEARRCRNPGCRATLRSRLATRGATPPVTRWSTASARCWDGDSWRPVPAPGGGQVGALPRSSL